MTTDWMREGVVIPRGGRGEPDSQRAWCPWVCEEPDGVFRMWYSGHDGTTSRIMEAVEGRSGTWARRGVAIDVGLAGDTDAYGVEAPSVVRTPSGYLMAYAGFDGETTRVHVATSPDGHRWEAQGPLLQRGDEDARAATNPCLLVTGERWWLFFSGYDGSQNSRRAAVLAAISDSGASWDRLGSVLEPASDELAVGNPCVLDLSGTFAMFYDSDDGTDVRIALATSRDGSSWNRRGTVLAPSGEGADGLSVHGASALRLEDRSWRMWYSGRPVGDTELAYEICSARSRGGVESAA